MDATQQDARAAECHHGRRGAAIGRLEGESDRQATQAVAGQEEAPQANAGRSLTTPKAGIMQASSRTSRILEFILYITYLNNIFGDMNWFLFYWNRMS